MASLHTRTNCPQERSIQERDRKYDGLNDTVKGIRGRAGDILNRGGEISQNVEEKDKIMENIREK